MEAGAGLKRPEGSHTITGGLRILVALAALTCMAGGAHGAPMTTAPFEFVAAGHVLRGVIDLPAGRAPRAVVLFVHGYGPTNVVAQNWYYDLRSRFTDLGMATVAWDKAGCGKSEGTFDIGQPVESSAREIAAALRQIREKTLPGVAKIGLWGISRAGWIAPMAMAQDPGIAFWISVSGTDDKENFPYFIESNFRIEGRSDAQIGQLMSEWRRGFELTAHGGTFEAYLDATKTLRHDPFMILLTGSPDRSRAEFVEEQRRFRSGESKVDDETGLMIYVPDFRDLLLRLNMPVLALFGEKDRNVDWRKTRALYMDTIGRNPKAQLTVKTFPDGNHNIHESGTGGYREMLEILKAPTMSEGYYEAILGWLRTQVLDADPR
jgi:pimeloyl-ACP methyl ester carboxylesterase